MANTNIKNYKDLKSFLGGAVLSNLLFDTVRVDGVVDCFSGNEYICDECLNSVNYFQEECDFCGSHTSVSSKDFFQYYIIDEDSANYLKLNTTEVVYYNADFDIYFWAIDHCGTAWENVPFTNWKTEELENINFKEECGEE